jgi:hypothetical protein
MAMPCGPQWPPGSSGLILGRTRSRAARSPAARCAVAGPVTRSMTGIAGVAPSRLENRAHAGSAIEVLPVAACPGRLSRITVSLLRAGGIWSGPGRFSRWVTECLCPWERSSSATCSSRSPEDVAGWSRGLKYGADSRPCSGWSPLRCAVKPPRQPSVMPVTFLLPAVKLLRLPVRLLEPRGTGWLIGVPVMCHAP